MKEALDLWRVQIHCDDVANTNDLQQIGNHARHDWFPFAIPLIRPSASEEGGTIAETREAPERRQASARARSSTR